MSRHIIDPQVVSMFFNRKVITPLGMGTAFGIFRLKERNQESVGERVVVRLAVDEQTRPHMGGAHCLTPRAANSVLFTFDVSEVEV